MELNQINSVSDLLKANEAELYVENIIDTINQGRPAARIEIATGILHGLIVMAQRESDHARTMGKSDIAAFWAGEAAAYKAAWSLSVDQQIKVNGNAD